MVPSLTPGKSYYIKAWVGPRGRDGWSITIPDVLGRNIFPIHCQVILHPTQASCGCAGLFSTCFIDAHSGLRWQSIHVEVAAGNKELRTTSKLRWYPQQRQYLGDKKLIGQFFQNLLQPSHNLIWNLPPKTGTSLESTLKLPLKPPLTSHPRVARLDHATVWEQPKLGHNVWRLGGETGIRRTDFLPLVLVASFRISCGFWNGDCFMLCFLCSFFFQICFLPIHQYF